MLMAGLLAMSLVSCSTPHIVTQYETIVLVPPSDLLKPCTLERVAEQTVGALAHGYIVNTTCGGKLNEQLDGISRWAEEQRKLYNDNSK
ncbi:Rz1-like lysis system protein LysC [Pseudomonas helleri]|uniref:Rz1-like lysis system protein LysC n=1 Tax=Pseudomonas helleri TaxID=1608996 RepID=UPI003C6E9F82